MTLLCQKAENEFVGLQCGIMDMFASMFGKKDRLIQLDCRSLEYQYIPFEANGISIVLFDTGVKHSLASTEYNVRRQECEKAVALIRKKYPHVTSLRDANIEMVNNCLAGGDQKIFRRARYIVQEIDRLEKGCEDLAKGDLAAFGKKMFDTHEGLSQLYEVSCVEADALVSMVSTNPGVIGARMMGGGFGGCTLNLVYNEALESTLASVGEAFEKLFSRELKYYLVKIDEGTSVIG
jgi:galactokinase